ncbi:MAG: GNAT family N-acetyltransferase [Brevundimonas sp.]|uniref:GNAT family N-acetyltransferase n=1 Tax=Brevundimonas sp. TaxID=1871086 RepID=UPI0017946B42|nr:GNAT family N-acetyltransferase [Brevundimonas sp.]MBA4803674.1 GNAT family N-acetyltransferase [Brevundimonas sp.]
MHATHPLDRPALSALTTRQARLALADGPAVRFDPAYALFAAVQGETPDWGALRRLARATGPVALFEAAAPEPPGLAPVDHIPCLQMVCDGLAAGGCEVAFEDLTDADGAEMLALATLTRPGPFLEKTHRLGAFVGVRREGRLVAMAGERLSLPGHTEVSGVCTHPDFRGQGLAGALMRIVTARILGRGDIAFLHARAAHAETIAFYETLGFRPRARIDYRVLAAA